jgi:hypothetical protein
MDPANWTGLNFTFWVKLTNWSSLATVRYLNKTSNSINQVAEILHDKIDAFNGNQVSFVGTVKTFINYVGTIL